jgi:hypothetical protein
MPEHPEILIKRYAGRRFYNTATSTYVSFDDLAAMVLRGQRFIVRESAASAMVRARALCEGGRNSVICSRFAPNCQSDEDARRRMAIVVACVLFDAKRRATLINGFARLRAHSRFAAAGHNSCGVLLHVHIVMGARKPRTQTDRDREHPVFASR